jgi:AraC-like DNA-binding protein
VRETTLSIRWLIPFIRVTGASPGELAILQREGIGLKEFVDPDARVRHRAAMDLLARGIERLNDPTLGLKAGERVEAGDYDALEYAARSCATARDAVQCVIRYQALTHGGHEAQLLEEGERATWRWRPVDDVVQLPAANDFSLVSACSLARRYLGMGAQGELHEVHFLHAHPTDRAAYARIFEGAELKFEKPWNALVFSRSLLDAPMAFAHAGLQAAYELHVQNAQRRVEQDAGVSAQVRALIGALLSAGEPSIGRIARKLAMSESTLRRRLREEGTTHRELLDQVRWQLAQSYLSDRSLGIREIAFLLGFAHVSAFHKAFRRLSQGLTPVEFRTRAKA